MELRRLDGYEEEEEEGEASERASHFLSFKGMKRTEEGERGAVRGEEVLLVRRV